jgi:hypothetical protein
VVEFPSSLDLTCWGFNPKARPIVVSESLIVSQVRKKKLLTLEVGDLIQGEHPMHRYLVLEDRKPEQLFVHCVHLYGSTEKVYLNICWKWLSRSKVIKSSAER